MEVYPKSSWFLLILGFVLFAATFQESTDCPTPETVSCTTGTKCNSNEDCQSQQICCANACYTKRCIPNLKGVQGESESDGPSESECRPYIEKALKELETGEAQKESSDQNESAEDIPTVEITDDSSHEVSEEIGVGEQEDESETEDKKSAESVEEHEEEEVIRDKRESVEEDQGEAGSEEAHEDKEADQSIEDKQESEENVAEEQKEESAENVEEQVQILEQQQSEEHVEEAEIQQTESEEDQEQPKSEEDEQKESEEVKEQSEEVKEESESVEEKQESKESVEEAKEDETESKEEEAAPSQSAEEESESVEEPPAPVSAEKSSEAKDDASSEQAESGCPPIENVSCQGGVLCSKHKECGENEICCPNKCYRKRCVAGTVSEAELAEEESDEDSEEKQETSSGETKPVETAEGSGCPSMQHFPCKHENICNKHKECGDGLICCANKCYRKQCVPGAVSEAELQEEESEEESKEKDDEKSAEVTTDSEEEVGCPIRDKIPCKGGAACGEDDECNSGEICCANKCYHKVCIPGTPAPVSEEASKEESKEVAQPKPVVASEEKASEESDEESKCPPPGEVSCREGDRCGNDGDCESGEICCPNKCYNKRCIPSSTDIDEIIEKTLKPLRIDKPLPKFKVEIKKEVKIKVVPSEPRKEIKKIEVKRPGKPSKVVVIEEVEEEDMSLEKGGEAPVEELSLDTDIPTELRPRDHVEHLLKLDKDASELESVQNKVYEETLKELKKLYDSAIKPLEVVYKYRDLSNRHFGDAEIFSKPLILFMGPWSGGKSSIINYLVNNEYNETSLRTGAEPSPAYFNILMYGEEPEIIDGTELAADFTFSGLQKFGQGLEERLRGVKVPSKLLEKVNIVEIPGILEVRKQVSRLFPFNDACQWFIDRADIIFLVYDPSKLDVGPETEAILDQLKGREHQTRIILNKADQVKPEELMRVQGALIWNISPLMSSPQPPIMYTTSLWSRPFEPWAPVRLLQAQERAFLRDLRSAVDKRVENKIASARRFAVRVRNHAKMVDCYLTTYYNHKSVFGNRKHVANEIIEHPHDYHIYEGLSTLTNISRYDLPDPEVYKDFFKLNALYEFQQLSATCTYFRGCPINRLDIAIAYDLPELVGTYRRNLEEAIAAASAPPPPEKKPKKSAPGTS